MMCARSCRRFLFLQVVGVLVGIVALSSCNNPVGSSSSDGSGSFMRFLPDRFMLDAPESLRQSQVGGPGILAPFSVISAASNINLYDDFRERIVTIEEEAIWTGFWFMVADQIIFDAITLGNNTAKPNFMFNYNQEFVDRLRTYFKATPMWDRPEDDGGHFFDVYEELLELGSIPVNFDYRVITDDGPYNHFIKFSVDVDGVEDQEMVIVWSNDRQHVAHVNSKMEEVTTKSLYFFSFDGKKNESFFVYVVLGDDNEYQEVILRSNPDLDNNGTFFRGRITSHNGGNYNALQSTTPFIQGLANDLGGALALSDDDTSIQYFDANGSPSQTNELYDFKNSNFNGMYSVPALQATNIDLLTAYSDFFFPD